MAGEKDKLKDLQEEISAKSREIWLAGLGLFAAAEEEGERLYKKFIERGRELEEKGEAFEKKTKGKVDEFASYVGERTDKFSKEVSAKLGEEFPAYVEAKVQKALESFGASSRKEVKELNEKVDRLTQTVSELIKKIESRDPSNS